MGESGRKVFLYLMKFIIRWYQAVEGIIIQAVLSPDLFQIVAGRDFRAILSL